MAKFYLIDSRSLQGIEKFYRERTDESESFGERVERCVRHVAHEVYQCPCCQRMVHLDEITGRLLSFDP